MRWPKLKIEWGEPAPAQEAPPREAPPPRGILSAGRVRRVDLVAPEGVEVMPDAVRVGPDRWVRTYFVHALPGELETGWLGRLLDLTADLDVGVEVRPVSSAAAQIELTRALGRIAGEVSTGTAARSGLGRDRLLKEHEDLTHLRALLSREEDSLYDVRIAVQVGARDREGLLAACRRLETDLSVWGVTLRQCFWRQAEGLGAAGPLPSDTSLSDWDRNFTRGAASATLPLLGGRWADPDGFLIGVDVLSGEPVFFSPWSVRLQMGHLIVIGEPGAGKSVLCKMLAAREAARGSLVVVIDHVGEYTAAFGAHLGAEIVPLDPERPSGINLLEVRAEAELEGGPLVVPLKRKAQEISSWVSLLGEFSPQDLALVEQAVLDVYEDAGITTDPRSLWLAPGEGEYAGAQLRRMPQLSDLVTKADEIGLNRGLVSVLRRYTVSGARPMFDCQTESRQGRLLVLDVRRITGDQHLMTVTMAGLLGWLWATLGDVPGPKVVLVDETWQLLRHKEVAVFLARVAREARKKHVALMLATQFIREFGESHQAQDVLQTAATRWIGRLSEEAAAEVSGLLQITEGQARWITGLTTGQFLLRSAGRAALVHATPTRDETVWYETDPRKVEARAASEDQSAGTAGQE